MVDQPNGRSTITIHKLTIAFACFPITIGAGFMALVCANLEQVDVGPQRMGNSRRSSDKNNIFIRMDVNNGVDN